MIKEILENKIGGHPYLPVGEEYPCDSNGNPMALLLQINLKDIDLENYPKQGILEIFTDVDVDYPCQYSIRYYEEGREYQTTFPDLDLEYYFVSEPYKISLKKTVDYMSINDYRFEKTIIPIINKIYETDLKNTCEADKYFGNFDWTDYMEGAYDYNGITIGGYPEFCQGDPREYKYEDKDECLFKLDSEGTHFKVNIGDCGVLFTLVSMEDIKNKHFENAIVDWDCC